MIEGFHELITSKERSVAMNTSEILKEIESIKLKSADELEVIENTLDSYDIKSLSLNDLNMFSIFIDIECAHCHDANLHELLYDLMRDVDYELNDRLCDATEEELDNLEHDETHTELYKTMIEYVESIR